MGAEEVVKAAVNPIVWFQGKQAKGAVDAGNEVEKVRKQKRRMDMAIEDATRMDRRDFNEEDKKVRARVSGLNQLIQTGPLGIGSARNGMFGRIGLSGR